MNKVNGRIGKVGVKYLDSIRQKHKLNFSNCKSDILNICLLAKGDKLYVNRLKYADISKEGETAFECRRLMIQKSSIFPWLLSIKRSAMQTIYDGYNISSVLKALEDLWCNIVSLGKLAAITTNEERIWLDDNIPLMCVRLERMMSEHYMERPESEKIRALLTKMKDLIGYPITIPTDSSPDTCQDHLP